jgi:hypothetical protein
LSPIDRVTGEQLRRYEHDQPLSRPELRGGEARLVVHH